MLAAAEVAAAVHRQRLAVLPVETSQPLEAHPATALREALAEPRMPGVQEAAAAVAEVALMAAAQRTVVLAEPGRTSTRRTAPVAVAVAAVQAIPKMVGLADRMAAAAAALAATPSPELSAVSAAAV
jgi:hypothetical protein